MLKLRTVPAASVNGSKALLLSNVTWIKIYLPVELSVISPFVAILNFLDNWEVDLTRAKVLSTKVVVSLPDFSALTIPVAFLPKKMFDGISWPATSSTTKKPNVLVGSEIFSPGPLIV